MANDPVWTNILMSCILISNPRTESIDQLGKFCEELQNNAPRRTCKICGATVKPPIKIKNRFTANFLIPKFFDLLPDEDQIKIKVFQSYLFDYLAYRNNPLCSKHKAKSE